MIGDSRGNAVVNNTFSENGIGVVLTRSHGNEVSRNNLSCGYMGGLGVVDSSSINLTKNCITGSKVGIRLRGSHSCIVSGNVCEKNERTGIFGEGAYRNLLESNNLLENGNGILLQGSAEDTLSSNYAYRNVYGSSLRGCTKNMRQGNILRENSCSLRLDPGQDWSGSSNHGLFVQDIDKSNPADNNHICCLVGKADLMVPTDCGFWGVVSSKNIRAANLALKTAASHGRKRDLFFWIARRLPYLAVGLWTARPDLRRRDHPAAASPKTWLVIAQPMAFAQTAHEACSY